MRLNIYGWPLDVDWIAPNCLNITISWASFIREAVVMGIRGCGSSALDWPVVTGWRAQTQQQVEARTHWNPFSDSCLPPHLQSGDGDACIYPYGICIYVCSISFCDPCLGGLITKVLWAGCQDLQTRPNVLCPLQRCYTLRTIYSCIMVYTQYVLYSVHRWCHGFYTCTLFNAICEQVARISRPF